MSIASEAKRCPNCGGPIPAEAPEGLCPKCLLLEVSIPTEAGQGAPVKSTPPGREELVAAFPNLEILELIGQGGMGYVFKARQPKIDRLVALKILPQSLAADPAFAERFAREGRLLARLNHPNIVTLHDFGQANGLFYLLMEFVDGVNLRQAMKAGRFTPDQALAVVPKICEALQYAHNEGVLHRDIKPENILLDTKGRVKIADFGIAKLVVEARAESKPSGSGEPSTDASLTDSGGTLGTPHYMAPEQLAKPAEVDHRADIYSLGVVFYEMLTGELPLGHFAPPSQKSSADPRLDDVVLRALAKKPEERTQSAGEVKTQVETIASTVRVEAGKPLRQNGGVRILSWGRRNAVRIAIVIGLILAVRFFALEPMVALTEGLAPEISLSSHCLVWKLARNFSPGDVVVFRRNGRNYFGRVVSSFPDSLVISRNTGANQTVPRTSVIGLVILDTRARAEAGPMNPAIQSSSVTSGNERGKTVVLTDATSRLVNATNNVRTVSVRTFSTVLPGETLLARIKHPDGRIEDALTHLNVNCRLNSEVSTDCILSWFFNEPFGNEEAEAAVTQLRQNKLERPIVLIPGQLLELFSVTNKFGGVMVGYLEFKRAEPKASEQTGAGAKPQATIRIHRYTSSYPSVEYSVSLPPGYALRATAEGGEAHTFISLSSKSAAYRTTWYRYSTFPGESAKSRDLQQSALDEQLQQLQGQGPISITLGQPRLVFSVTNGLGEVYSGFFELAGPPVPETRAASAGPPTDAQPGKVVMLTGATNELIGEAKQLRIVSVHMDSTLNPGETLIGLMKLPDGRMGGKLPDGRMGGATTSFSIQRRLEHVQTSSYFIWVFPDSFSPDDCEAAAAQLRQTKTGRPLVVIQGEPLELFSVTNRYGGVSSGYLQFKRVAPEDSAGSGGKVHATVRLRPSAYGNALAFYSADVPPGYFLEATANWAEVGDCQAETSIGGPERTSSWMPPATSDYEHGAAAAQFRQLAENGALQVFLGEPRLVFSITNKTGEVFKGFFELVGPPSAGNK